MYFLDESRFVVTVLHDSRELTYPDHGVGGNKIRSVRPERTARVRTEFTIPTRAADGENEFFNANRPVSMVYNRIVSRCFEFENDSERNSFHYFAVKFHVAITTNENDSRILSIRFEYITGIRFFSSNPSTARSCNGIKYEI